MVISNRTGGGEIVSADEDTRFYDDVGCLAADAAAKGPGTRAYVRIDAAMVAANEAFYARPAGARTPMGSGIVAFRTADEARSADPANAPLAWSDVLAQSGGGR
jgi:hypothetical protein